MNLVTEYHIHIVWTVSKTGDISVEGLRWRGCPELHSRCPRWTRVNLLFPDARARPNYMPMISKVEMTFTAGIDMPVCL